jgi:hypothetical protein
MISVLTDQAEQRLALEPLKISRRVLWVYSDPSATPRSQSMK